VTLAIDIGNTRIDCAVGCSAAFRIIELNQLALIDYNACIISSVVPQKTQSVKSMIRNVPIHHVNRNNLCVDFSAYTGTLGEDRIVACHIAKLKYNAPLIVVDFGTATTVNVVDAQSRFLGGLIMAGVETGPSALSRAAAQLPDITDFHAPLIGADTSECLAAGATIGAACAVEGYIGRVSARLKARPTVVLTGGNAPKVLPYCTFEHIHEPSLLMEGLFKIYETR
jgi:type III pantothenate kinase